MASSKKVTMPSCFAFSSGSRAAWASISIASGPFIFFGVRFQTEKYFSSFGERVGSEIVIGKLVEVAADEGVDGLTVQAGVYFNALIFAFESFNDGQRFSLKGVESQFDTLDIVVISIGPLGAAQDPLFENGVGAFEIQHFREFRFTAEEIVPRLQIGEGAGKSIEKEIILSCRSGDFLHCRFEQSYRDFVGHQLPCSDELFDRMGGRASCLKFGAEQVTGGQVSPTELGLGKFTHGSFSSTGASEDKDHIRFGAGLSWIVVVKHDLRCGRDALFVDMPLSVRRRHLLVACGIVGEMTVETTDSPGVVSIGV